MAQGREKEPDVFGSLAVQFPDGWSFESVTPQGPVEGCGPNGAAAMVSFAEAAPWVTDEQLRQVAAQRDIALTPLLSQLIADKGRVTRSLTTLRADKEPVVQTVAGVSHDGGAVLLVYLLFSLRTQHMFYLVVPGEPANVTSLWDEVFLSAGLRAR